MEEVERNIREIEELIINGKDEVLFRLLKELHPADIADIIEHLDEEEKRKVFSLLDIDTASDVIVEISKPAREEILESIKKDRLSKIVDEMPSDDATDFLADLPENEAKIILARIDKEDSEEVRMLSKYGDDTAGGIMQAEMVSVNQDATVKEAIREIRSLSEEVEDLHNVFVVDREHRLTGVLPLRKLILAQPDTRISRIMESPIKVDVHMDQEEVARVFEKYDIVSVPVVDEKEKLVGRILVDDIVDVIQEEASEDFLRMGGTEVEDLVYSNQIFKISRFRLPWLLTNLLGGIVTGYLLWMFKMTLHEILALVTFIPVITGMGGNLGTQSSAIMVRGFAIGKIDLANLWRILSKEVLIGLMAGTVCGALVGLIALFWHGEPILGLAVGLAMVLAMTAASIIGVLAPSFFKTMKIDPAIASGPFVTTTNDITGISIYLGTATLLLKILT
ncbi:MAG: magnesium transporter [Deltaproteobacteria bacterium]|nr:MAG: magnesium transporter [Deltaproteobacteria bacterium]